MLKRLLFVAIAALVGCRALSPTAAPDAGKVGATVIVPPGSIVLSGDVTGTAGATVVSNVSNTNSFTITPSATLVTFDSAATTIYTEPAEATQTVYDYVGTVVGVNTGADSGTFGDMYRADFAFDEQRTDAGPVAAGAAPVALNVRTTGNGSSFGGITFTTSSNSVVFQVAGSTGNQVSWSFQLSRSQAH